MENIDVRKATEQELNDLGVKTWPVWECEPSTFDWEYSEKETCYIIEGRVTVRSEGAEVSFKAGDLVVFPQGLQCTWKIDETVRKHYKFG